MLLWKIRAAGDEAEHVCGPVEKPVLMMADSGPAFLARRFSRLITGLPRLRSSPYRTPTPGLS